MYAAAGGASLASRQARQRQRQNKKAQQSHQKELKPHRANQYHNYTDDAAVPAPVAPPAKLSRVERGALKAPAQGHTRRHSASNYHLKEPAKPRLRESPSISIPVQGRAGSSPTLPQIPIPEGGTLERRCSFVRQVEEMERSSEGRGLLDRCNHLCNFEINRDKLWECNVEHERDFFGSSEYPFSECSQGRAAWQERERGRRCSLTDEARQHRVKQTEAHHRWMKRNRIHDSTYGAGSDDDDFFNVYHQSAAANALLYVGLGTTAIGSVIFFVGTGEKGFKTLELRLIGPTLIACGLLCCLIRVLLCACPSTCLRRRKKTRLKADACPHAAARYPRARDHIDFHVDSTALLSKSNSKKKVSIVQPSHPLPSTSTQFEFEKPTREILPSVHKPQSQSEQIVDITSNPIPKINLPITCEHSLDSIASKLPRDEDSIIELQNLELVYDIESVTSDDDDEEDDDDDESNKVTVIESFIPGGGGGGAAAASSSSSISSSSNVTTKLTRTREPVNNNNQRSSSNETETCLSVVIERSDNSESSDNTAAAAAPSGRPRKPSENKQAHSGIVLSPLQLGQ